MVLERNWNFVADDVAQHTAKKPTTQTPTTSMRLRAASIIPDNANAKVASNSMLGSKVEPQVSKLFIDNTLIEVLQRLHCQILLKNKPHDSL